MQTLKVGIRKLCETPANFGSRMVAMPFVATRLNVGYERRRRAHIHRTATLPACDAQIVAALHSDGAFMTSLDDLELDGRAVLAAADQIMAKHFPLDRTYQCDRQDILAHPEIFRWGLHHRLLDIAEHYLGVPIGYDGINIFLTKADSRQSGARRWHRDVEDRRMLKIALYVHEVTEDAGPLQVLTRRLPNHDRTIGGKFPILTQQALERAIDNFDAKRDVATFTGKRGTLIFADTAAHFHRGMPAIHRDRCAIYFNYMGRVPLRPFRCERTPVSRADIRRLVADLPPHGKSCALWRDSLPFAGRLIPAAPIWK